MSTRLIRRTLAGIDPNLTVMDLRPFDAQVAGNFNEDRLLARLSSLFGILALILASVGLYGVMSYFVARRTSEIGIRMALGATRASVLTMVMRSALWQILIGLALGIPASLYAGHLMKSHALWGWELRRHFDCGRAVVADSLRHRCRLHSRAPRSFN